MYIANPIYDSVFKYLMEDKRITKTILSALLQKEVVEVEGRPHEYANGQKDGLTMFRIDFSAKVREPDGHVRLILIELQKTWLDTEVQRFRQYLGTQYSSPSNLMEEEGSHKRFGIPMVAVYLLGHRIGKVSEPVVYFRHKPYDYEGRELHEGFPDAFAESLIHDSIIVQIPLLHGQINNRLDKVLSVFDQTHKDMENRQLMSIDESRYAGDEDMLYILHRLKAAAADTELRQTMNVEDEYFQAIDEQKAEVKKQDRMLKAQAEQLAKKDIRLAEKDTQLAEKDSQIRSMATAMLQNGMTEEQVCKVMKVSLERLHSLLQQ